MYTEVVTLAVMIGCIPCIIHSWFTRGPWQTVAFFIGGFVFGIVRENIVALLPALYTYPDHPLYIGAAPLMMGFGWSASFYASWSIAEVLLKSYVPPQKDGLFAVPFLTAIIAAAVSIVVEVPAGAPETQWWIWPPEAVTVFYEMPAIVPFGWAGAAFLFILVFNVIMRMHQSPRNRAIFFVLAVFMVILIHLIYTLVIRTLIIFLIGL